MAKIGSFNIKGTSYNLDANSLEGYETVMCKRNFVYDAVPSEDSFCFPSDFKYGSGASQGQFIFSYNKSNNQGTIRFNFNWAAGIGPFMIAEVQVTLSSTRTGSNLSQSDISHAESYAPFRSGGWGQNDDINFEMLLTCSSGISGFTTTIDWSICRSSGDQSPENSISITGTGQTFQTCIIVVPLRYVSGGGTN